MDGVISTAAVPGRKAPLLIIEDAVKKMKPGSVIVDLAAETGGNCELTKAGETVMAHDVKIVGPTNLASTMPDHASQLYAKNVQSLVELMVGEDGALNLDFEDEIIKGACITRDGEIVHERAKEAAALMDLLTELTILVLAAFVGFEVISRVPNTLHTPLMSATNAIHGIVLLGGILIIGEASGFLDELLLVIAIAFGTINVVGGFLVTDRMLEMFKARKKPDEKARRGCRDQGHAGGLEVILSASFLQDPDFIQFLYIVAFVLFIVGLRGVTHPTTARRGNHIAAVGMAIAVVATLLIEEVGDYGLIALGVALGTAVGIPAARQVKMTAMPQMVALFNGVGGGAVALISYVEYREALEFGGNPALETLIPILFAAIVGSVSFWGSNIAFAKLQEILPGKPIAVPGQQFVNLALLAGGGGRRGGDRRRRRERGPVPADPGRGGGAGQHGGAADRRRRHAGGDLAAQRAHRTVGGGGRHGAGQRGADRGRHHRGRLGLDPHQPDGRGDEPLDPEHRGGRVRRRRHCAHQRRRRGAPAPLHRRHVGGQPAVAGRPRGRGAGLRPGGGPGPAHRARAGRRAGEARRGGHLCDPPGGGAHARPHERAAGRGRRAL